MKKTKEQKRVIRDNKMWPLFWNIINDRLESLLIMNWLTGEFRVLDK